MGRPEAWMSDDRSGNDVALDLAVGLGIEEYRWVEWSRKALREAPLYEPGRFVGHPGDLLSHLYVEASRHSALAAQPFRRLPRYSADPAAALRAAERAGLFGEGGATISCTPRGVWHVSVARAAIEMDDDCLPRLLSRAALAIAGRTAPEGQS